jgi:hypothetical protein
VEVRRLEREADPPAGDKVKNAWSCSYTFPVRFIMMVPGFRYKFSVTFQTTFWLVVAGVKVTLVGSEGLDKSPSSVTVTQAIHFICV